jgi:RimJ/RimL family protein N-acetyltransferase
MDYVDPRLHAWYTYFLLVQASDCQAVGVCGFKGAPSMTGSVEVGYAMHEAYRNKGYMTEAVRALVQWAFTQPDCNRVIAETLRTNLPSQKVLQKAGMHLIRAAENMLYWQIEKAQS